MKWSARVLLLAVMWTMVQTIPTSCIIPGDTPQFYYPGISADAATSTVIIRTPVVPDTSVLLDQVVMITQVHAGSIDNENTANYGSGCCGGATGAISNDAGYYEFNIIANASCSGSQCTLTMMFPLEREWKGGAWTDSEGNLYQQSFQVAHAMVCDEVVINGNYQIPPYENGAGGILAIISNHLNWTSGIVDASGRGHRGGPDRNEWTNAPGPFPFVTTTTASTLECGRKGSGFIGTSQYPESPNTYPAGMDGGIGAPGNAGGGGCRGGGGGGGANGGVGGYGGNPPGRGHGGSRTLDSPIASRIFFGGSGGSGHRNSNTGAADNSRGWPGGGIVYIHTRSVHEARGRVESRGSMPEFGMLDSDNGGGGGGAGGTVVLLSETETAANWQELSVAAQGGSGTMAAASLVSGGGGGGGIVMSTAPSFQVLLIEGGAYGGSEQNPQQADGEEGLVAFDMSADTFPSQRIVAELFAPSNPSPTASPSISFSSSISNSPSTSPLISVPSSESEESEEEEPPAPSTGTSTATPSLTLSPTQLRTSTFTSTLSVSVSPSPSPTLVTPTVSSSNIPASGSSSITASHSPSGSASAIFSPNPSPSTITPTRTVLPSSNFDSSPAPSPSLAPLAPSIGPPMSHTASPSRFPCSVDPPSQNQLEVEGFSSCVVCESGQTSLEMSVIKLQSQQRLELLTASGRAGSLIIPSGLSAEGDTLRVEFVRDSQGDGDTLDGVGSTVISIVLQDPWGEAITHLDEPLSVCLEEASLPGFNADDLCLGYYHEEQKRWRCEDHSLSRTHDGQLCGKTPHLTNFALLLGSEDSSDGWNHVIGWLSLGFAAAAVAAVALSAVVVEGWYRYQQHYRRSRLRLLSQMSNTENQHML